MKKVDTRTSALETLRAAQLSRRNILKASLAAGAAGTSPEAAIRPIPEAPTAAEPAAGQGRVGAVPGIVDRTGLEVVAATCPFPVD